MIFVMEIPVVFGKEGHRLVGMLHTTDFEEKRPGVVLFHGFTGNKIEPHRLFVNIARDLCMHNINVLRFDFYGSGDSEGEFVEMTFSGEVEDAFVAVDFLKEQECVDPNRIGILGLSMGGAVASYVAGKRDDIKSVVLVSAVADLLPLAEKIKSQYLSLEDEMKDDEFIDYYGWQLGLDFIEELSDIHPVEVIKNFKGPALIIHGVRDEIVPLSDAYKYLDVLSRREEYTGSVDLVVMPEADHTFNSFYLERDIIYIISDWFIETL